jgi:geranylgeranyl diphosphate synthase, type I
MRTADDRAGVRETELPGFAPLLADRELLNRDLLRSWCGRDDGQLGVISEYALVPAGKMLRPLLVLESARCVGGSPEDLTELALAVEYLHVATLVHDDIIDGDDMRRGRPSVQAAFGVPAAIVAGDGLILETFAALAGPRPETVSDVDVIAMVAVMASAGLSLCRGQLLETELAGDLNCTVDQYLTLAELKTGALFESACRIGAILGAGRREWVDALGGFGKHLGVAFQIRDDLLAFDGSSALIGKPRESDLQNHRPTLPVLLAYQRATGDGRTQLERAFSEESPGEDSYAQVRGIVETTGAREAAGEYAAEMIRRARHRLTELPTGESIATLGEIADYASGRRFGHARQPAREDTRRPCTDVAALHTLVRRPGRPGRRNPSRRNPGRGPAYVRAPGRRMAGPHLDLDSGALSG